MSLVLASEPTSLVAVNDQCAAVEAWAEQCESIPELKDASNRLAAIDEYLSRTSTEGRGRVAAAMRRLEVRIGKLLGPGQHGGDRKGDQVARVQLDLERTAAHRFRQMAEHPEVVEEVIAESTDQQPASRRKITERIRAAKEAHPKAAERLASRIEKATQMAAQGFTSRQIAESLGYSRIDTFSKFRTEHGIEVPADKVMGANRRIDPHRVVEETALALEGLMPALKNMGPADIDPDRIANWLVSLRESRTALTQFLNKFPKETSQ